LVSIKESARQELENIALNRLPSDIPGLLAVNSGADEILKSTIKSD